MKSFNERQLQTAVDAAGLEAGTFERLRAQLLAQPDVKPGFEAAHVAYYLGALLIIGAMGWFMTNAWDSLGGLGITAMAVAYGAVFGGIGVMMYRKGFVIPGGLLATVAVCMTPLAVYGIERKIGWWPEGDPGSYTNFHPMINGSWVGMEAVTILVAALFLKFVKFPFLTAPAAYALWYMSMDATSLIFGRTWDFHHECWISAGFGVVMLGIGYFADGDGDADYSFWFYLFGLIAFCGGLSLLGDGRQMGMVIYCVIHLCLIVLSLLLQRRAFLVFGAIGVFAVLCREATEFFQNSYSFTLGLTLLGIAFIALGMWFKNNEAAWTAKLKPLMPERVKRRHDVAV
jgi:hypothetical protein